MRYIVVPLAFCSILACSGEHKDGVHASSGTVTKPTDTQGKTSKDVTAMDQSNVQADVDLTQRVRKALVDETALSVAGKNITVVSAAGVVTLKGMVASADEHSRIKSLVNAIDGVKEVDDQLQIKAQ